MDHKEIRIPPQNIQAERSVLGSMMMDDEAIGSAVEILDPSWFYEEAHRKIYNAICDLYNAHKNVDLITLSDKLTSDGVLDQIGGVSFISELVESVPSSANVEHYANIVKEKGVLRRLIKCANQIIGESYEVKGTVESVVDNAERLIFEIADLKEKQKSFHIKDLVKDSIENLDKLYQRKEHITGLATNYIELDKMMSGLQKSDLIILAGRPSMGKSALAVSMAERVAIEGGHGVAIFSLEMSKEQLVQRLLCSQARVDAHKVRNGFLSPDDWPKLTRAASVLSQSKIYIDDTPAISAMELRAKARRLKANHDIQLVVLDYLQLMRSVTKSQSREQEISEISRSLKALARELRVPIIALSQLSRAVESRTDHRPQLSDLRESGAIEQDADVVILMMREEYYNPTEENKGITDVILAKQRNGPVGVVKLLFLKEFMRFENLARNENLAHVD
jgi:replicative DNA helicase